MDHARSVMDAFSPQANAYLTSEVHSQGHDLQLLAQAVADRPGSSVLDLGCGAGHVSFAVAPHAHTVTACDLTASMLETVAREAGRRGIGNLHTQLGSAEALPFADASFDFVLSRYSAHHWRNLPLALRETRRVLKPGGKALFADTAGGSEPLFDTYLQALEVLRDASHVRDYTESEWIAAFEQAGFHTSIAGRWPLPIAFSAWIARIGAPEDRVSAIRSLWERAPEEVRTHFNLQPDLSFVLSKILVAGGLEN